MNRADKKPIGLYKITDRHGESRILELFPSSLSNCMCCYWPQDIEHSSPSNWCHIGYDTTMIFDEIKIYIFDLEFLDGVFYNCPSQKFDDFIDMVEQALEKRLTEEEIQWIFKNFDPAGSESITVHK